MSFTISGSGMVNAFKYGGIATAVGGLALGPMLMTQIGNESNSKPERAADATAGLLSLGAAAGGVALAYAGFKHKDAIKSIQDRLSSHAEVLDNATSSAGKIDGNKYLAGAKTFLSKMAKVVEEAPHVARA